MLKKFVLVYLLLHVAAIVVLLMFISGAISRHWSGATRLQMEQLATVMRHSLEQAGHAAGSAGETSLLRQLAKQTGLRVSVIGRDGKVRFDSESDPAGMENHADRPELQAAIRDGTGFASRTSRSTGSATSYFALPLGAAGAAPDFLRIGAADTRLEAGRRSLQRLIWLFGLSMAALAATAMWAYAFRQIQPMREFSDAARRIAAGQLEVVPAVLDRDDEWRDLSLAFRHMQAELSQRESGLVENSDRLEAVLSSMVEGVIAADATGRIMLANQAACDMLELGQRDMVGRKLLERIRVPQLQSAIERTQLQRTYSSVEFQTFHRPRRTITARVSCLPGAGTPGVTLVLHDVTELRSLEAMRRDFVANVSHELKTPLSSIKALAETLRLGALDHRPQAHEFVVQIEQQADLLNKQIQDLLHLARVESGQASFEIARVPLATLLDERVRRLASEAEGHHISLELEPVDAALYARADAEALGTIIDNLLTNAIRYSPPGEKVHVRAWLEEDRAVVAVIDHGIGIAPEHHARVFERFYRVDRARSREAGGTGLGLSIVKHLVQAMGGSVRLRSEIGKGSTFVVGLPGGSLANAA